MGEASHVLGTEVSELSSPLIYLEFQKLYIFFGGMLMARNPEECDKHSEDNNEILHTTSEVKTFAWREPPMTTDRGGEREKQNI